MLAASLFIPTSLLAAGAGLPPLVQDIGTAILVAGILAIVAHKSRVPTIAAFLLAGVLIGPIGAKLVTDQNAIETIAELGLILLLFGIGMELDIRKLLASGKTLVVTGLLQYPLTVVLGIGVAKVLVWWGLGSAYLEGSYALIYVGLTMGASSTLLVVKLYQETFQLDTVAGRMSLGLLIFQDIWAIVVIAIQPNFADPDPGTILIGFLGIGLLIALAILLSRTALERSIRWVAKTPELMLISGIAWCFGIAFLGSNFDTATEALFGFNLHLSVSPGMGALIAGATMANLPFHMDIVSRVGTVKDFFVTLFFVGLGMSIPVPETALVIVLALAFSVVALLSRYLIFFPLLFFTGLDRRNSFVTSTRLAQVSEFTLVIAYAGMAYGHISPGLNSAIIFAFVITALITPILFSQADWLHELFSPLFTAMGMRCPISEQAAESEHYSLALLGFHRVASSLLHEIERDHPELLSRTLVVDINVSLHEKVAAKGATVRYGDLANVATLHHSGVDRADVVICTIPDDLLKGVSNRNLVSAVRHLHPEGMIIANAIEFEQTKALYEAGADYVYLDRVEAARGLMQVLSHALCGELADFRSETELESGHWHEREEVLE